MTEGYEHGVPRTTRDRIERVSHEELKQLASELVDELEAMAGRLLPEDTRTEWGLRFFGKDDVGGYDEDSARAVAAACSWHTALYRRVGPWVPVPCPDELCGADGGRCPTCGIDAYAAAGVPAPEEGPCA